MKEMNGWLVDNFEKVERIEEAPHRVACKRCGLPPTAEGHDPCLGALPGVSNACCGHGWQRGYIAFTNGVVIRGDFKPDHMDDGE